MLKLPASLIPCKAGSWQKQQHCIFFVKEERLALALLEQIKNGADFGKLAKKHSICPSGKCGGCSGQQKLTTILGFFQYLFSDSFGGNPPLYS